MPSAATGAKLANSELLVLGISGDGDTASIGLGQYCHMIRRNLDCTYIVENNGCYGLTKGQFSATADVGSKQKGGKTNEYATIDICGLAIELGATFVARSFSGDGKQLVPLLQAAFSHRGTAILDVISPCVTFNDHEGSTKSYAYVKEHDIVLHTADYIAGGREITVDYEPGTVQDVTLDDGSHVLLRKLDVEYDPTDGISALRVIHETRARGEFVTGLLYVDTTQQDLCAREHLVKRPLAQLDEESLRIGREEWRKLMDPAP
jgi:2-oxoglutarate ferredoxin oxidoreductase subunit beta